MTNLVEVHMLAEKANPERPPLKNMKDGSPDQYSRLAKIMLEEAKYIDLQPKLLKGRPDKMVRTVEESQPWARTFELFPEIFTKIFCPKILAG